MRHVAHVGRCLCPARLLLVLLAAAPAAGAQIVFEPPVSTVLTHRTEGVISADVDLDGHADLITMPRIEPPFGQPLFSVLLGDGDGGFAAPIITHLMGDDASRGHVAPLNGDAFPDLALSISISGPDSVQLLFGAGDGTFPTSQFINIPNAATIDDVVPVDVTGDGLLDLVVLDEGFFPFNPGRISVLVATGGGAYTLVAGPTLPIGSAHVALGSVNEDSLLDAVVSSPATGSLQFLAGAGGGAFAAPVSIPVGGSPAGVLLADLGGDGLLDLAFADSSGNRVVSMHGDGEGHFATLQSAPVPGGPRELSLGNLDPDGAQDLLVSAAASGELAGLRGAGDGTFALVVKLSHVPAAGGSALADFDEDGVLDAAVGTLTDPGTVLVARNHTYAAGSPFTDLGHALPGTNGWPILLADGDLQPATAVSFALENALPAGIATLFLGFSQANLPYKGGLLIPPPDVLITPLTIGAGGSVALGGAWPAGIPAGFTFYVQYWFKDNGAIVHQASSSGVRIVAP